LFRYFSIPRPELTEDCPGYGWVGVSDTSCALPVLDRSLPWAQASKECNKKGAQLASVNSAQAQDRIDQIVKGR
jgi:Lectin C-type domain